MTRSLRATSSIAAAILLAAGALLTAGPLNPPAGPVAGTYKTLPEGEPRPAINATNTPGSATGLFRITQSGSYYLTGNITGVLGKSGIEIASDGVTIDLCGFSLIGGGGSTDGIATAVGSLTDIAITNGSIRGWTGDGIDLATNFSTNTRICDVQTAGNGGVGIKVANNYIVERCGCRLNGGGGLSTAALGIVRECQAVNNSTVGMVVGQGATVAGCFSGFNLGVTDAIRTGGYCTIRNCTVDNSPGNGLVVGDVSTVTGCAITGCNQVGLQAGQGCTVVHCSVNFSQTINLTAATGSTVSDCTVQFGNLGGIECSSQCVVRNNLCSQNANGSGTGFNIHASGADNRIESNNCTQAGRGIKVDVAGNVIVRNTCSGNANNFDIAAGNVVLAVFASTNPAAILGGAGGVAPGSTDPSANFSF